MARPGLVAGVHGAGPPSYPEAVDRQLWWAYDAMGDRYREHAEDGVYNAHYDRPAVLEALGPLRDKRVLDAGCGPGLYAEALASAGAQVVGFDASEAMAALPGSGSPAGPTSTARGWASRCPTGQRRSISASARWRSTTSRTGLQHSPSYTGS